MHIKAYIETLIIDGHNKAAIITMLKLKGYSNTEIEAETALLPTIPSLGFEQNFIKKSGKTPFSLYTLLGLLFILAGVIWNIITGFHSSGLPFFCIFVGAFMVVVGNVSNK